MHALSLNVCLEKKLGLMDNRLHTKICQDHQESLQNVVWQKKLRSHLSEQFAVRGKRWKVSAFNRASRGT